MKIAEILNYIQHSHRYNHDDINYLCGYFAIVQDGKRGIDISATNIRAFLDTLLKTPKGEVTKLFWYGNYGGPGTNSTLLPIDALDAACLFHDKYLPKDRFQDLTKFIRRHFGAQNCSTDANWYIDRINGLFFSYVEPVYMNWFVSKS
ncbi:predicted protein [Naegleria gruberi]|uniref:Predicted protein n=1 Tax=Naegleria gruberi TaxID=5762 RepID=D2W2G8_NAEGR|nr:uncharacterized protein NAEGRDRAFT_75583 [Naegleria gruberi]EFC36709.1 predicted protein [Naegleria gruberi]|eukprot:XP_002669453.1 predicted protein [Naegleria gruberi strain NEG-M]